MKPIFKKILQYYLKYITKIVLFLHRPTVIAVAGSTNKTFVKKEIRRITKEEGMWARSNQKCFNTEIGLTLAILELPSGYNSYLDWLPTILKAPLEIFKLSFPRFLVLELGVSEPRDMKFLLSVIKPEISVITDITQRYLGSFFDMDALVREYEQLVKKTKKKGLVILNYDNPRVKNLEKKSRAKVEFFGLKDGAHWQAVEIKKEEDGQSVKVSHNDIVEQHKINRFGEHHVYSLLVGLIFKDYAKKNKKIGL